MPRAPQISGKNKLVLASASPRRSELLRNAGIPFVVQPAHVDERVLSGEPPLRYARRLAREKAEAVHKKFPQSWVLGADTIVVVEGEILGKPRDVRDAARMLRRLGGRSHRVTTAVCLIGPDLLKSSRARSLGRDRSKKCFTDLRSATTKVFFCKLSAREIADYAASGEPMDKAGGYAIQGIASRWIPKIAGCYFNVVGLPVPLVAEMLRRRGFFD